MKKLRVTIDIEVYSRDCEAAGVDETDVLDSLDAVPDDAMDGVLVFQQATDKLVLGRVDIIDRKIVAVI